MAQYLLKNIQPIKMRKLFTKKLQKTFYWASTFTEMVTFISEYWGTFITVCAHVNKAEVLISILATLQALEEDKQGSIVRGTNTSLSLNLNHD